MPQNKRSKAERRLSAGSAAPEHPLEASEVRPFLDWLFSDLAFNYKPLKLRWAAAAIRYLENAAWYGVPTEIVRQGLDAVHAHRAKQEDEQTIQSRQALKQVALMLWGSLFQFGEFDASTKEEARDLLDMSPAFGQYAEFERARKFLDACEVPPGYPPKSDTRHFAAKSFSQPRGNSYLEDDLSERIAAADAALDPAGVENRHVLIAEVLQVSPLTAGRRPKKDTWGPVEVRERVRTYRRRKVSIPPTQLASNWIGRYRTELASKRASAPNAAATTKRG